MGASSKWLIHLPYRFGKKLFTGQHLFRGWAALRVSQSHPNQHSNSLINWLTVLPNEEDCIIHPPNRYYAPLFVSSRDCRCQTISQEIQVQWQQRRTSFRPRRNVPNEALFDRPLNTEGCTPPTLFSTHSGDLCRKQCKELEEETGKTMRVYFYDPNSRPLLPYEARLFAHCQCCPAQ